MYDDDYDDEDYECDCELCREEGGEEPGRATVPGGRSVCGHIATTTFDYNNEEFVCNECGQGVRSINPMTLLFGLHVTRILNPEEASVGTAAH